MSTLCCLITNNHETFCCSHTWMNVHRQITFFVNFSPTNMLALPYCSQGTCGMFKLVSNMSPPKLQVKLFWKMRNVFNKVHVVGLDWVRPWFSSLVKNLNGKLKKWPELDPLDIFIPNLPQNLIFSQFTHGKFRLMPLDCSNWSFFKKWKISFNFFKKKKNCNA
jgi:hypothetical protein